MVLFLRKLHWEARLFLVGCYPKFGAAKAFVYPQGSSEDSKQNRGQSPSCASFPHLVIGDARCCRRGIRYYRAVLSPRTRGTAMPTVALEDASPHRAAGATLDRACDLCFRAGGVCGRAFRARPPCAR